MTTLMETLYKLTNPDATTQNGVKWQPGHSHRLPKIDNPQLCQPGVFHAYRSINLAFLLNPIHANFPNPRVFEARGTVVVSDWGKAGCFGLKIVRELEKPTWVGGKDDLPVRLQFAALCAKEVLPLFESQYPNDRRPRLAIQTTENRIAAFAAHAVGDTANASYVAANAADDASYAAAHAAHVAANNDSVANIDFGALADQAVRMIMETK